MNDEFISMRCPHCTGNVKVENEKMDLFVTSGDNYLFIGTGSGRERIACEHCNTEFVRRQQYSRSVGSVVVGSRGVVVQGNVGGSIITGNIKVSGDFAGGRKVVIK